MPDNVYQTLIDKNEEMVEWNSKYLDIEIGELVLLDDPYKWELNID